MASSTRRGQFITFEGIEGSGKSVQLRLLEDEFRKRRLSFVSTREPGGTAFGLELRQVLLHRNGAAREPVAELLIYLADRYQHLKEKIEPSLARGFHVLCDRYHDATLAYQGQARGIGFSRINQLARILELRNPDVTLVLDVAVELGLSRAKTRNREQNREKWGRFELEDRAFHQEVREGYRLLAQRDPARVAFIDGSGSPGEVFARILDLLQQREIL